MTDKQHKTLTYAGFTEAQITALGTVFNVLPPPERKAEIDGFVRRTAERMREIDGAPAARPSLSFRLTNVLKDLNHTPKPPTP